MLVLLNKFPSARVMLVLIDICPAGLSKACHGWLACRSMCYWGQAWTKRHSRCGVYAEDRRVL